jgi:hypothetical protein
MSIEQDIEALQADVASRQQATARAEHELAQAQAREHSALQDLSAEFGVTTIEVAQAKAGRYEAALTGAVAKARQALAQAGEAT